MIKIKNKTKNFLTQICTSLPLVCVGPGEGELQPAIWEKYAVK